LGTLTVSDFLSVDAPTPNPAIVGQVVTFRAVANAPPGAFTSFTWNFGDSPFPGGYSGTVSHVYTSPGTFMATIKAKAGTASGEGSFLVVVLPGFNAQASGSTIAGSAVKKKFSLNFKSFRDSLTVTMSASAFRFLLKQDMYNQTLGKKIGLLIGDQELDSAILIKGKGNSGVGKYTWNYKKGEVKYTGKKPLQTILAPYGAVNAETFVNISVPMFMEIGGVKFGGNVPFLYSAKLGKTGKGK